MGEVLKPERLVGKRKTRLPEILPKPPIQPSPPTSPSLNWEIQKLKNELEKIKQALKKHGIVIE